MISFALALFLLSGPVNGEAALRIVKEQVRAFGDRAELRVQQLTRYRLNNSGAYVWSVRLTSPQTAYESSVDADTGKLTWLTGNPRKQRSSTSRSQIDDPAIRRRAATLFKATHETRLVGKPVSQLGGHGDAIFWYPLLLHGYRIFGSTYCVTITFDGKSGQVTSFRAGPDLPSVNTDKPAIDRAAAAKKLESLLEEHRRDAKRRGNGDVVYKGPNRWDLGYYVPEGGGLGRLAWRTQVSADFTSALARRSWDGVFLIDAVTGQEIHYTVQPFP